MSEIAPVHTPLPGAARDLCGRRDSALVEGACRPCRRRFDPLSLDPPLYTGRLVAAARAEALELWPALPLTAEQTEIILCAALARAARDLDAGGTVHLEYLGELRRVALPDGPVVRFRADRALLEVPRG